MLTTTTNAQGQTTLKGKIALKHSTTMTRYGKFIIVPAGTIVDYVGLRGVLHYVSLDTQQGTFGAAIYEANSTLK